MRMRLVSMCVVALAACTPRPPSPATSASPSGTAPTSAGEATAPGAPAAVSLDALTPDTKVLGFAARTVYLDASGKPLGARFVHEATGFTFDYLRIESAPQGYVWVNSYPSSDMGEPHTQE